MIKAIKTASNLPAKESPDLHRAVKCSSRDAMTMYKNPCSENAAYIVSTGSVIRPLCAKHARKWRKRRRGKGLDFTCELIEDKGESK